jgi:Holliday junction resolvase RusA-like endonuclease
VSITFLNTNPVVELVIAGAPKGKDRPRMNRKTGAVFTPKQTKLAETVIIDAWVAAGSPRVPADAAARIEVVCQQKRPRGHYRKGGGLNTEGFRHPLPRRKPDVDNVLKLVMDALNRRAYRDDVDIVEATVRREWADWEGTTVRVWAL